MQKQTYNNVNGATKITVAFALLNFNECEQKNTKTCQSKQLCIY